MQSRNPGLELTVVLLVPLAVQEESTVMKWAKGEISNYTYLMVLNHAAGK